MGLRLFYFHVTSYGKAYPGLKQSFEMEHFVIAVVYG